MSKEEKSGMVPKLRFAEFRDCGEWEEAMLGSAARFLNGRAYKQEELFDKGKYLVLRVGNFFTNKDWYYSNLELEEDKYCEDGDLLYAWSASFGPKIWHGEKTIYHYHIWKVVHYEHINKKFLYILLDFQTEKMKSQSANGFALLHITKGTIENWKCHFPSSKNEQQKIADCLSSLDEYITAESQQLEALKVHKKGLMQQLFPAEGETVPQLRFAEFRDSGEWEEKMLENLVSKVGSGVTPLGGESNYRKTGRPFVRSQNVGWGIFLLDDIAFIDERTHQNSISTEIKAGDVLLNITGASIGRSVVANIQVDGGNVNQHVCIIRTGQNLLNSLFLNQYLISPFGQRQIDSYQAGGNRQGLNFAQIRSFSISVPPQIEEQQKIADCLSSLDELIAAQVAKIEALKLHKKGLMQGLFPQMPEQSSTVE